MRAVLGRQHERQRLGAHLDGEEHRPRRADRGEGPCQLRLVVDGKAVANPDGSRTIPATVHESPLPRSAGVWHPDGTFEAPLVPGTYRFSVYATPEGGGELVLFAGEVTVPAGDAFEASVELKREQ